MSHNKVTDFNAVEAVRKYRDRKAGSSSAPTNPLTNYTIKDVPGPTPAHRPQDERIDITPKRTSWAQRLLSLFGKRK
ncbi:MAG: hypothetical protein AB1489_37240 [Acidobacteriota bacterium]